MVKVATVDIDEGAIEDKCVFGFVKETDDEPTCAVVFETE